MAHHDGSFTRRLRFRMDVLRKARDRWRTPIVPLHDVRRRLELLVMALYDTPIRIEAAPVVERRIRFGVRSADDALAKSPPPGTLWLPAELAAPEGIDDAIARYRTLALDGAARIVSEGPARPLESREVARDATAGEPATTARATEGERHGVGEKDAAIEPEQHEETTDARGRATDEVVDEDDPDAVAIEDAQGLSDAPAPTLVQRNVAAASGALAIAAYDEWDTYQHAFRRECVTVRTYPAPETDDGWARSVLDAHRVLVRRVRAEFERLRSRRERLFRQRDGDQLDIGACIEALTQLRMGRAPDDRLYIVDRAGRRALAIMILVDTSGSTRDPVGDNRPVIEIEKIALLLASEALDALGDRYALLTFSSHGAADVRMTTVKGFADQGVTTVRSRIGAIAPGGNTRMGAAIRHATSLLVREPVAHRLLLVLSDGKPNDTDRYYEHYGVEDTRAAVLEARASGVSPFCITVDANEPEAYVSHIFGEAGHTILRRPDQLPSALLGAVKLMLGT